MASKGKEKHQARQAAVSLLGKDLARRAGRKCELCEGQDDLRPYDSQPDAEPTLDTLALLCARCRGLADGGMGEPDTLRFLESSVWSEVSAVSSVSRGILRRLDADWARATLEMVGDD